MVEPRDIVAKRFVLGADLGQSLDPTALAAVERITYRTGERIMRPGRYEGAVKITERLGDLYRLRAAELLPLGTNYHAIADHLAGRYRYVAEAETCSLVFDETGARAAGDLIRARVPSAIACVLTASESDQHHGGARWSVSKANMVTGLLAAIESGDLEIADGIRDYEGFKAHLVDLRRRVSALGHFSFNAREGGHDDFVTAAGLALWWAKRPLHHVGAINTKGLGYDANRIRASVL